MERAPFVFRRVYPLEVIEGEIGVIAVLMVAFGEFSVGIDGSRSAVDEEDEGMAFDASEMPQVGVCTSSFAVMAMPAGSSGTRREGLEDLSEFAANEGEEEFMLGGVEGAMTVALMGQDVVGCEGKAKASSIGGICDEDIRINEVVGIFHDDDFGSSLFHLHALRRDVISERRCKITAFSGHDLAHSGRF